MQKCRVYFQFTPAENLTFPLFSVTEPPSEPTSPEKTPHEQSDFTEFAKVVYRRLKVYRGIYIFYSIITFMLGLPVMVTGFKKQFFSGDSEYQILDCPHYLGIVSILSCFISLWTALKNQIVLCVLTLLTGIVTVISAMIVLVTSALDLSATPFEDVSSTDPTKHLNQQTHVVFIFSIGLLIASLAIVITTMSHLSARRVKRVKIETPSKVNLPRVSEQKEENNDTDLLQPPTHRYSFASTISSLIKHELKDNKNMSVECKERLKKTLSCPSETSNKNTPDLLDIVVSDGPRKSTHSLPIDRSEYNDDILDRWRRASFLTKYYTSNGEV